MAGVGAPSGRKTRVGSREMGSRSAQLASMEPSTLVSVLSRAARGDTRDYADLCDRMVWFDGNIRANLETRIAMVGAAQWEITPGKSRDPARQAVAAEGARFAEDVLRDLDVFEAALMQLLGAIGVGWSVCEKVWDRRDGADVLVDLAWLHPRRFRFGTGTSSSGDAWELLLVDDGETWSSAGVPLDPERFVVHTPSIGGAYPGVAGVLRSCAWPYLFRRWTTQFWVRGVEKFAWPTLVGKVLRGAGDEVRAQMKAALRDAANDHYLVTEVEQEVSMLETLVKDAGSFAALDEALKAEISKAILGSTDQTEPVKIGAWKAVESRKGTTVDSRVAVDAYGIERTVRGQILEPLMRYNGHLFGGVIPATPEFTARVSGTRQEVNATELGALVELARSAGMQPTEQSVRELVAGMRLQLEPTAAGESAPRSLDLAPTDLAKVVKAIEARASQGLGPFGDDRDERTITELGASAEAEPPDAPAPPSPPPAQQKRPSARRVR